MHMQLCAPLASESARSILVSLPCQILINDINDVSQNTEKPLKWKAHHVEV